jgi:cholestenol delta-isomerase
VVCSLYDPNNNFLILVEICTKTIWYHLAGTLHCFFEGYFMINHDRMASAQDFFGQLWKEYALSDSRYMTSDTLVLCMETITVVS